MYLLNMTLLLCYDWGNIKKKKASTSCSGEALGFTGMILKSKQEPD